MAVWKYLLMTQKCLFSLVRAKEDCEELKMDLKNLDNRTNIKTDYILQRRQRGNSERNHLSST